MNKGKKSILNAITALFQMAVASVLGLIFNKIILQSFGSAYNGINATITQIVNTIMIVEGGFTLASNVALFRPWSQKDKHYINGILAATHKRFVKIGCIALGCGLLVAIIYPLTVRGILPYWMVVGLVLTVLLPTCFNLGITTKYRVILLTEQKEYIISIISTITYTLGILLAICAVKVFECSLLTARVIIMVSMFVNYMALGWICMYKYKFISFKDKPLYNEIKGTRSVIVMKLTSVFYSSAPIIVISMIPAEGAILASIYAVYNSIMSVIGGILHSVVNAPRLSFGAALSEKRKADITSIYSMYEMIMLISMTVIVGTTAMMIMPFVGVYTKGIEDANYYDTLLAVMLITKYFIEIVHIPAGQMIQMSGNFEVSKKINTVACLVLIIILGGGLLISNMYLIVAAMLVAAIVLAISEVFVTEKEIIDRKKSSFGIRIIPAVVIVLIACLIGMSNIIICDNYLEFFGVCLFSMGLLAVVTLGVYYFVDKDCVSKIINYIKYNVIRG